MNRTLLEECFEVAGRTTWYVQPAEIQRDLDKFIEYFNLKRSHQGYRLKGRTTENGVCSLPAEPEVVAAYVVHLAEQGRNT